MVEAADICGCPAEPPADYRLLEDLYISIRAVVAAVKMFTFLDVKQGERSAVLWSCGLREHNHGHGLADASFPVRLLQRTAHSFENLQVS